MQFSNEHVLCKYFFFQLTLVVALAKNGKATAIVKAHLDQSCTWVVRPSKAPTAANPSPALWRFLPIHSACARQPPVKIISALLRANPQGAQSADNGNGRCALHYA